MGPGTSSIIVPPIEPQPPTHIQTPSAWTVIAFLIYWTDSFFLAFALAIMVPFATMVPQALVSRLRQMSLGPGQPPFEDIKSKTNNNGEFEPEPIDVVVVRFMLQRRSMLPPDIVDNILDSAEYWAHSSNEIDFLKEQREILRVSGTAPSKDKFIVRSYPVGLTGLVPQPTDLAEVLAYDTNEAKPLPLDQERTPQSFAQLVDYPTPVLKNPVRKVVFTIKSKDQGWGGQPGDKDTYNGSWTWFEAGLERFDERQKCHPQCTYDVRYKSTDSVEPKLPVCALRPLQPAIESDAQAWRFVHPLDAAPNATIQKNKTAHRDMIEHVVTWSYTDDVEPDSEGAEELDKQGRGKGTGDGSFVRNLKMGDVITVWAKARFPGWMNHVQKVKIDVYWAT